jgi:hypothetical protein
VKMSNQPQAKRFFIDRIIQQAQLENILLSDSEKYMLSWSESEEGFRINQRLMDQFYAETSDKLFEKKIIELLKQAYNTDVNKDKGIKESYQKAYSELNKGDHYILVMIKSALGSKLANKLRDRMLLVLSAIGASILMIGIQFLLRYLGIKIK